MAAHPLSSRAASLAREIQAEWTRLFEVIEREKLRIERENLQRLKQGEPPKALKLHTDLFGEFKHIRNLMEWQHAVKLQMTYPDAQVLLQPELKQVMTADGQGLEPPARRIQDAGVVSGRDMHPVEIKTEQTIVEAIEKRGNKSMLVSYRKSSALAKQLKKEARIAKWAKKHGARLWFEWTDLVTGQRLEGFLDVDEIRLSRVQAYGHMGEIPQDPAAKRAKPVAGAPVQPDGTRPWATRAHPAAVTSAAHARARRVPLSTSGIDRNVCTVDPPDRLTSARLTATEPRMTSMSSRGTTNRGGVRETMMDDVARRTGARIRRQGGYATVGGMTFSVLLMGSTYLLVDSIRANGLVFTATGVAFEGAAEWAFTRFGRVGLGTATLLTMVLGMKSDQGGDDEAARQRRMRIDSLVKSGFPELDPGRDRRKWDEAWATVAWLHDNPFEVDPPKASPKPAVYNPPDFSKRWPHGRNSP